jgi:hypothetical protein
LELVSKLKFLVSYEDIKRFGSSFDLEDDSG